MQPFYFLQILFSWVVCNSAAVRKIGLLNVGNISNVTLSKVVHWAYRSAMRLKASMGYLPSNNAVTTCMATAECIWPYRWLFFSAYETYVFQYIKLNYAISKCVWSLCSIHMHVSTYQQKTIDKRNLLTLIIPSINWLYLWTCGF